MAARKAALVDLGAGYAKIDPARAETARIRLSIAIQQEYDGERDVLISRPQAIELYVTQAQAAELASALTGARFSAVPEEGRAFALSLAFDALKSAQGCIGPRRPGGSSEPQSEAYDHDAFMWDYYQRAIDALEEVLA